MARKKKRTWKQKVAANPGSWKPNSSKYAKKVERRRRDAKQLGLSDCPSPLMQDIETD